MCDTDWFEPLRAYPFSQRAFSKPIPRMNSFIESPDSREPQVAAPGFHFHPTSPVSKCQSIADRGIELSQTSITPCNYPRKAIPWFLEEKKFTRPSKFHIQKRPYKPMVDFPIPYKCYKPPTHDSDTKPARTKLPPFLRRRPTSSKKFSKLKRQPENSGRSRRVSGNDEDSIIATGRPTAFNFKTLAKLDDFDQGSSSSIRKSLKVHLTDGYLMERAMTDKLDPFDFLLFVSPEPNFKKPWKKNAISRHLIEKNPGLNPNHL